MRVLPALNALLALSLGALSCGPGATGGVCEAPTSKPCPAGTGGLTDCFATSGITDPPAKRWTVAGGSAIADLNGDGLPEIFYFRTTDDAGRLYQNLGGFQWKDITCTSGLPARLLAGAFGDLDNDGDADLVALRMVNGDGHGVVDVRFFENDGHGHFRDDSVARGFDVKKPESLGQLATIHLTDLDLDGRLDVLAAPREHNFGEPALWLSGANATWNHLASSPFPHSFGWTHAVFPTDYNRDGLPDLMVLTDDGNSLDAPSRLYLRTAMPALEWTEQPMDGVFGDHVKASPMGAAAFDLDGDGALEYGLTDDGGATLMHLLWANLDRARELGIQTSPLGNGERQTGWSPAFVDLDTDGVPELFITTHATSMQPFDAFAVIWRWNGARFTDASSLLPDANTHPEEGLSVGDLDGDGKVDLFTGGYGAPPRLLRNDLPGGNGLSVTLSGARRSADHGCNADGFGARVTVEAAGLKAQTREHYPGGTTYGWSEPRSRFGLGAATSASRVRVDWRPCGGTLVQELVDVPGGNFTVEEPR